MLNKFIYNKDYLQMLAENYNGINLVYFIACLEIQNKSTPFAAIRLNDMRLFNFILKFAQKDPDYGKIILFMRNKANQIPLQYALTVNKNEMFKLLFNTLLQTASLKQNEYLLLSWKSIAVNESNLAENYLLVRQQGKNITPCNNVCDS